MIHISLLADRSAGNAFLVIIGIIVAFYAFFFLIEGVPIMLQSAFENRAKRNKEREKKQQFEKNQHKGIRNRVYRSALDIAKREHDEFESATGSSKPFGTTTVPKSLLLTAELNRSVSIARLSQLNQYELSNTEPLLAEFIDRRQRVMKPRREKTKLEAGLHIITERPDEVCIVATRGLAGEGAKDGFDLKQVVKDTKKRLKAEIAKQSTDELSAYERCLEYIDKIGNERISQIAIGVTENNWSTKYGS